MNEWRIGGSAALPAEDADGVGEIGAAARVAATVSGSGRGLASGRRFGTCKFVQAGAFAGREEEIGLDGVLLGVEVVVAAAERVERFVRAAFDDAPRLHDEHLLGAANRGEPVRDD